MAVTKVIYMDLKDPSIVPGIHIPRGDSGLRILEFHFMDGNTVFEIPTDATVTIRGTKADKNGFTYACPFTAETGIVYVEIKKQMTAAIGPVICEIAIVNSSANKVATFVFYLIIEKNAVDDNTNYSESDFAYIEEILDNIQANGTLMFVDYTSESLNFKTVSHGL